MRWVHKEIASVIAQGGTCPVLAPNGLIGLV